MKSIIKSLVVIVAVAAVAGTATWSYFTDQAVVQNNTFSSGKLDFTLNGDMTETLSLALTDLVPGEWSVPKSMKVYNKNTPASTIAMKYRITSNVESETLAGLADKINVKVEHGNCVGGGISPITKTEITKLDEINWVSTTDSIAEMLDPNITHCFQLSFQLDPTAGNTLQGQSAVADIIVDGTQQANPGWAQ